MKKAILLSFIVICLTLLLNKGVYAEGTDTTTLESTSNTVTTVVNKLNDYVADIVSYDNTTKKFTVNYSAMDSIDASDKKQVVNDMMYYVSNSALTKGDKNRVGNLLSNCIGNMDEVEQALSSDVGEEVKEATTEYTWMAEYINPALGFVTYALVILFVLSYFLDIAFLLLPLVQTVLLFGESDINKAKGVSKEAKRTILEIEEGSNANILILYFKKRAILTFVTLFVIAYIMRGKIFSLAGGILDLFSGFF